MDEKACRIAVSEAPGVGAATYFHLMDQFSSAEAIWQASPQELRDRQLAGKKLEAFLTYRQGLDPIARYALLQKWKVNILVHGYDEAYPRNLFQIKRPPPVLYLRGSLFPADQQAIAVVGTRNPTNYGVQVTHKLVSELAGAGITIVSGMALGIDGIAHKAALAAGGRTIAVLGGGFHHIFPKMHQQLFHQISKQGAVISPFPPEAETFRGNFVARNRYVAGLSLGVLVIQGASQSGTRITAQDAIKQQKPVFAVPGPITSEMSAAPTELLKLGAHLVSQTSDILDQLGIQSSRSQLSHQPVVRDDPLEQAIWECLNEAKEIDMIARELAQPIDQVSTALTLLEIDGLIQKTGREWLRA